MKLREVVKIDEKEITLKELAVIELLYICNRAGWIEEVPGISFEGKFEKQKSMSLPDVVLSFVSDISKEEAVLLAPSEIQKLYEVFMKMNEVTFATAKYFGLDQVLVDMKEELIKVFIDGYTALAAANIGARAKGYRPSEAIVNGTLVPEGKAVEE